MNFSEIDTPFLWTDLDIMEKNILNLSSFFRNLGLNWRPHTKGIKIPAIAHMLTASGASGITCAKLSEAEVMAESGINNILIANQVVGFKKIERLALLAKKIELIVAVDNENIVKQMNEIAEQKRVKIRVLVEVNVGMDRAGVQPGYKVLALSKKIKQMPGLIFDGVMAWEGHSAGITDIEHKKTIISKSMNILKSTISLFKKESIPINVISGAGSATYLISTIHNIFNEIQAGGAVFTDQAYKTWGVQTQPSLFVRSCITSRPTKKRIITDAGFKALPGWIVKPYPLNVPEVELVSMSAEHGVITLKKDNSNLCVGSLIDYQVGYGDATVFLHDTLYGYRKGSIEEVWEIKGRGKIT